jgi:GTPase SAR1 family protein
VPFVYPHFQSGQKPLHAYVENQKHRRLSNKKLKTLQELMSYGAVWDATCDDITAWRKTPALRLCILLWAQEHADGLELSDIPIEVIKRGVDSTQQFIDALKTSLHVVLRRKICLVGSSFAGKTSFAKSITSELLQPQLEHVDDRTIGIDHIPLRFEQTIASRKDAKIHEVTFWDFAGQNAYQVAHSLFFSPRTLFLVVVDLHAFAIAYMQAVIFANEEYQETKLLGEFVEDSISHWIRLILARQPDADFVFIATKDDVLKENTVTEVLLKEELMKKLRGVGMIVEEMKKAAKQPKREIAELKFASIPNKTAVSNAGPEPRIVYVSCTSSASIRAARTQVEELIITSKRSVLMPDTTQ